MSRVFKNKTNILQEIIICFITFYFSFSISWNVNGNFSLMPMFIIFIFSYLIIKFIFNKAMLFKFESCSESITKKEMILYGIILLLIFSFSLLALWPAVTTSDSVFQWQQVHNNNYTNWHPVIQTLIFFKLPSMFYDSYVSCAIFQMLFIGAILLYFCYFLRKYFVGKKETLFILFLIILNPSFIKMSVTLWKDIAFSWCVFLDTLFLIEIIITKGKWIDSKKNKIFFILSNMGVMLFRHNGVASVILLFLCLIILLKNHRKFYVVTGCCLIALRFLLYGPIYSNLKIGETGGKGEMLGVPLNQIAYVYHQNVEMSKNEIHLLDELADKSVWEDNYSPLSFNDLKWKVNFSDWINNNFNDVMNLWLKMGLKHPKMYIVSYFNVTSPIWKIGDGIEFKENNSEEYRNNVVLNSAREIYNDYSAIVSGSLLKYVFTNIGMGLFLIVFALCITINKVRTQWEKYLPFIIVVSNTLLIMCLITGGEVRFVYSQILCAIPLLLYSLNLNNKSYKKSYKRKKKNSLFYKFFIKPSNNLFIQFIRYGFVGGLAAVVNVGMLFVFTEIFNIHYIISNVLAFILGLIVNYILSKKIVFVSNDISPMKEFAFYSLIGVFGLMFDTAFLWLFTDICGIFYMLSKLLSTVIVLFWNFGARKLLYKFLN